MSCPLSGKSESSIRQHQQIQDSVLGGVVPGRTRVLSKQCYEQNEMLDSIN